MRKNIITGLILLITYQLVAQDRVEIFSISAKNAFPTSYDSSLTGKAKETAGSASLTVPVPISDDFIIYNNISYFYYHVDNEPQIPTNIAGPIDVHGFILRTGIVKRFSASRSIQVLFSPRYMSDMKGGSTSNIQIGGLALYEKKYSDNLTIGYGTMVNNECFGILAIPLVNVNWQISKRVAITGLLPIYGKVKFKLTDKFNTGMCFLGLTNTFRLNSQNYKDDYIERKCIDLGLYANYNIYKDLFLEGRFGRTLGREYKQYKSDDKVDFATSMIMIGDNRQQKNIMFEDGFYCELRIVYSIKIPDKK